MRAFLLLLLALIVLSPERALLAQPLKQMYQFTPLQAQGFASIEAVLTVSKEPAALSWAYDGKLNLHNKFGPDRGFNPAIEYVGLFDSRSCYNYVGAIGQKPRPRGAGADQTFYAVSDAQGYFKWLKPTIEDLSVVALAASRPKTLSVLTLTPRSKIGICNHPEEKTDPLSFSGNWLNYIASSRLDAFLAFLYGGRRLIDSDDRTVITHSLAPLAWGEEILADREFTQESSWHPWYDISKFTPFPRPEGGRSHLLVRGGDFSEDDGHWPALKVLLNVSLAFFNQKELKESRINLDFDKNQLLSLWLNLNIPSPDDSVLTPRALKEVMVYNLKAEVCASQAEALSASCLAYRGSSDKEGAKIFKPAGLIQRLSESQMGSRLGLAIKSFSKSIFLAPAPISGPQSLAGAVPAIDSLNGQIVKGGLIDSLEKAFDNERFGSV
ncbi:MAG: hypothetical protein LBV23_04480, partial [Deltaproteobacteria bacterium]|nr:hypothetical protein [Deltaproteobacteria bacterium]